MIATRPDAPTCPCVPLPLLHRCSRLLALLLLTLLPGTLLAQNPIEIPDANLQAAVRSALGKPSGALTDVDMLRLTQLGAAGRNIQSLAGLEYAVNLENLNLEDNAVADASPLAGLTNLRTLFMDNNQLSSGAPLAGLTNLLALLLSDNHISDTDWLAGLTQLQSLSIMFNPLHDATVVGRLTQLTDLHLNGTQISDAGFLRSLGNLTALGLGDNNIHDGSPVGGLTRLEFLGLGSNPISDWSFIRNLTNLRVLYLFSDSLQDISFLSGLHNLAWLRLSDNHITDLSPLAGLSNLQYLDLDWNAVTSCHALAGLTVVTNMDLSYNAITDLNGLGTQGRLTTLNLQNNQVGDASPLATLTGLETLSLQNNRVGNLNFAQALTHLVALDASQNRLTSIQGLMGAVSLRTAALNNNLLLLAPGSQAQNVVAALQSRGVAVDVSSQSLPYVATSGTYYGLFYDEGALSSSNSGSITLTVTASRYYTGKLQLNGGTFALSGTLRSDGTDTKTLLSRRQTSVRLDLVLQGSDYLTGSVAVNGQGGSADILGYRAVFHSRTNLAPQAGRYTLAVAGSDSDALPGGSGYGTFSVSSAGQVKFVGSFADGTKVSQSSWVAAEGQWPFYAPLYSRKGMALGWMGLTNGQGFGGTMAWVKPTVKAKCYPAGFGWVTEVAGSRYTPPSKGSNVFGTTNATLNLTLTGGDLKGALVDQFTLNGKNQVKALPTSGKLSLSFTPSTGLFHGRAIDPVSHKTVPFSGVILQSQSNGVGYFLGTSTSGATVLNQ